MDINTMMEQNINMTYDYALKAHKRYSFLEYDDIHSACLVSLWKACKTFDKTKSCKLSTLAYTIMKNDILKLVKKYYKVKEIKRREEYSLEYIMQNIDTNSEFNIVSTLSDKTILDDQFCNSLMLEDVIKMCNTLEPRRRKIFNLFYRQGYEPKEIAMICDITHQAVYNNINVIENRIKKYLQCNKNVV